MDRWCLRQPLARLEGFDLRAVHGLAGDLSGASDWLHRQPPYFPEQGRRRKTRWKC
jgi:hypothetical protein